jgi:hypothetical protein
MIAMATNQDKADKALEVAKLVLDCESWLGCQNLQLLNP